MENPKFQQQYDRQVRVIGEDAMKKMASSRVLICGMDGLGVEIAKNVILMGFQSITLHDEQDKKVSFMDLGSQV